MFGKGGEPYMEGLNILWRELITPYFYSEKVPFYISARRCFQFLKKPLNTQKISNEIQGRPLDQDKMHELD